MTRLRAGAPLLALAACVLGASELARPLRPRTVSRARRWPVNGILGALAAAVERGLVSGVGEERLHGRPGSAVCRGLGLRVRLQGSRAGRYFFAPALIHAHSAS